MIECHDFWISHLFAVFRILAGRTGNWHSIQLTNNAVHVEHKQLLFHNLHISEFLHDFLQPVTSDKPNVKQNCSHTEETQVQLRSNVGIRS